ncbi:MAG: hypothetical protein KKD35_03180 [Elusimicrobia bacterium]|nr:hypothetical protein [Elusimicrobiota bacterium]
MQQNNKSTRKRRAMTTERAREVKLAGHAVEKEFADLIGGKVYRGTRKKDVLDAQGNIHSVKSGDNKWQIFLYSKKRFETSIGFLGAPYFLACIDAFPKNREEYESNKKKFKSALEPRMIALKKFLLKKEDGIFLQTNKMIFLQEAIFHSSEVDYLAIKKENIFHIFDAEEVIKIINNATTIENSKASQTGQMNNQKVIFKLADSNITIGEIEMRNESDAHYKQMKFWMSKDKTIELLKTKINLAKKKSDKVIAYGKAVGRFKKIK